MSIEVKVPVLPESVSDATIATWHKKAGDSVRRDENLLDLETDKVVLEVPAPVDGVLKQIVAADGAVVTSGQVLALLEPGDGLAQGYKEPIVFALLRQAGRHILVEAAERIECCDVDIGHRSIQIDSLNA